jgi:hypothetical protein
MPKQPRAAAPTLDEFRQYAREQFEFLCRDFDFREEALPLDQNPHLNKYAIWFTNPITRVVVEGIHYGTNARVGLGSDGPVAAFEDYDLGDLLAIRRPQPPTSSSNARRRAQPSQLELLALHAAALREAAADVLRGDHTVFPQLAARVAWRRAEFAAGRDPRT